MLLILNIPAYFIRTTPHTTHTAAYADNKQGQQETNDHASKQQTNSNANDLSVLEEELILNVVGRRTSGRNSSVGGLSGHVTVAWHGSALPTNVDRRGHSDVGRDSDGEWT